MYLISLVYNNMKNFNLVIKIPIVLFKSDDIGLLENQKDIEDLYNTHKHILLDLIENLILNDDQEYKVTIEKIIKEKSI